MRKPRKRIAYLEQIISTALLREDSANRFLCKVTRGNVSQLELEHLRILLWVHFLEDIISDEIEVRTLLGKGERPIYDEAIQILTGEAGWDYSPKMN